MKKIMTVLLALVMALALLPATVWAEDTTQDVAKAELADGTTATYATLVEAVKNVKSGGTVTLLKDFTGGGVGTYTSNTGKPERILAKDFTIDFGGYTYTMIDPTVGSTTFETQCFHFEWAGQGKTNYKVTLKNGTLKVGDNVQDANILIQNYCDLTLDGMKLDGTNLQDYKYVLSNNCGNVTIKDTVITAASDGVAMDVYGGFHSYSDVVVTVTENSVINGKIEVDRQSSSTNYNKNVLKIEGGTVNGELMKTPDPYTVVSITGGTFKFNPLIMPGYVDDQSNYDVTIENGMYTLTKKTEAKEPAEVKVVGSIVGGDPDKNEEIRAADVKMTDVENDKELTFSYGENIDVTFNQEAVKSLIDKENPNASLALEIKTGTTAIDANKTAFDSAVKDKKEGTALVVSLNLVKVMGNEELVPVFTEATAGATATVTVPYTLKDGETLVVYYLNGDKLEKLDDKNVTINKEDGTVTLTLAHFSEYVFTTVAAPGNPAGDPDGKPTEGKGDAPKTFDAGVAVYGMTAILSVTGMAWMGLKKRK